MIKYVIQVKSNYDYKIVQLDLQFIPKGTNSYYGTYDKDCYVIDRAAYDADYSANKNTPGYKGYYGNKIWKVPSQFRGRNQIDPSLVFDTREDAALAGMKVVEAKVKEDIHARQLTISKLEQEISNLASKNLAPKVQFVNGSTMVLKKGRNP